MSVFRIDATPFLRQERKPLPIADKEVGETALRDIRTGEMVDICRDWLDNKAVLAHYPITAPFVDFIALMQTELTAATRSAADPLSAEERAKTKSLLDALDSEWDRAGHHAPAQL